MALAQTEEIARRLTATVSGLDVEVVKFDTRGDIDQTSKLLPHGGKGGAFVAQIRAAVLKGELHAAMHSLKDMLGNEDTPGLVIGATLSRDPPGDVLVVRPGLSLDELRRSHGKGFRIGTNAVRRAAYARRLFPGSTSRSSNSKPPAIPTRSASCCRMAARAAPSWRKSARRCSKESFRPRCIR